MPVDPKLLEKIGGPLDIEAGRKASDMLKMAWGNANLIIGNGQFPVDPGQVEFDRMGLELVKTGKINVKLKGGSNRTITVDELKQSMLPLADSLEDEAGKNGLKEAAKKLDDLQSQSKALGKVKVALAESVGDNTGSFFGMSFGNMLGGLFQYIGAVFSWLFSGAKGEFPGFRETMARNMAGNVRESVQAKLQAAAADPDVAALLATRGDDGRLLMDTLTDEVHDGVLKEGGVSVPERPARVSTKEPGDVDGYLREQVRGVNEYAGRQIAAAAMGAQENNRIRDVLEFNVGSRKIDLNYGAVTTAVGWVRAATGYAISDDNLKKIRDKAGARIAKIFDEHAGEYAKLKTADEKKAFIATHIREELVSLRDSDDTLKSTLTDNMMDGLAAEVAAGVVANEKQLRLLPPQKQVKPKAPAVAVAPDKRMEEALGQLADKELKDTITSIGGEALYKKSRDRFIESGKKILEANPKLLEEKKFDELSKLITEDIFKDGALIKEFKEKAKTATVERMGMKMKVTAVLALAGVKIDDPDDTKLKNLMAGQLTPMLKKYAEPLALAAKKEVPAAVPGVTKRDMKDIFDDIVKAVEADERVVEGVKKLKPADLEKYNKAKDIFTNTAVKVVQDNPALVNDRRALAEKIIGDTKKALKADGIALNDDGNALLGQLKVEMINPKFYDQIVASATVGKAPAALPAQPVPAPTEAELDEMKLYEALKAKLEGKFAPGDPKSAFFTDVYKKREKLAELPEGLPKTIADAVSKPMAAALGKDGALVKKNEDGNYVKSDEEAFLAAKGQVFESLKDVVKDEVLRGALAEEMAVGLLTQYRPGFKAPDKHRTHVPALLSQEIDAVLKDGFNPALPGNEKVAAMVEGLEVWNGKPINYDKVRAAATPIIARMLADEETRALPPAEFKTKLNGDLATELCKVSDGKNNDCGFTNPDIIANLTPVIAAQVTEKIYGAGTGDLQAHENGLRSSIESKIAASIGTRLNPASNPEMRVLMNGLRMMNGGPLNQPYIQEATQQTIMVMLKDEKLSRLPPDQFSAQLRARLEAKLCECEGDRNKAGFTDPKVITEYSGRITTAVGDFRARRASSMDTDALLHSRIDPMVNNGVSAGINEFSVSIRGLRLPAGWAANTLLMDNNIKALVADELVTMMKQEDLSGKSKDEISSRVRDRLKDRLNENRGAIFNPQAVRRAYIYRPKWAGGNIELGTVDLIPDWVKTTVIDKIADKAAEGTSSNLLGAVTPDINRERLGGLDSGLASAPMPAREHGMSV